MTDRRYLVEFDSHTGSSTEKVRLSTGVGFQTGLSETPSRAVYLPLVKDAGNVNSFLFKDASTVGSSELALGKIQLNNADGTLDYLEDRGLGGFELDVREETGTAYPSDFPVRIAAAISFAEFTSLYTTLAIKDRTSLFRDLQYQPDKYSGDNNGSSIELEGTADDIGGAPKPLLIGGTAKNITPAMVNEAKEIRQISSEPIAETPTVYVGRSTISVDTVHTDLTTFLTDTVTAGQFNVYLGDYTASAGSNDRGCYIMLGTTPSHPVTVDAIEGWKNQALYSEDFSNAAWTKSNVTIGADSEEAPDQNTTADTLTASAGNATCLQTVTASSDQFIYGMWLKRKTGTGNIDITTDGGSNWDTVAVTRSWTFFECTAQTTSNPQFGVRIVTSGDEVYAWGAMCCQRNVCGPYVKTEGSSVYNNHIPALLWKIMNLKGYTLDADSIALAQAQFSHHAQHWQGMREALTGTIIDQVKDSGLFYLTADITGNYIVKQLALPTSAESVKTYVNTQILGGFGSPKIKKITSKDAHKGIPVYNVNIGYEQNYTIMGKESLTGAADTTEELAYVSAEYRNTNSSDTSVQTKYPNSPEVTKETKLIDKTGADALASYELNIEKVRRPIIEIKVPIEFATKSTGVVIQKGEVITVDSKHYRIIGQKVRLPSDSRREVTTGAITYQAWGGVA